MRKDRVLSNWLFLVCFVIVVLVIFGGYVRLTRSGLSIVEWEVITGVVPPLGEAAWEETFAKYRQTPEFLKVNSEMTLAEYKTIYYNEYIHRMLGRFVGLLFVVPLVWFLARGRIAWRDSGRYVAIALLFALQGFLGWFMVRSGLVGRPSVSHIRLMVHLLAALTLYGLCFWTGLSLRPGLTPAASANGSKLRPAALVTLVLLGIQIAWGALVAGLKAGHASDTFPLMFGEWVPGGIFTVLDPAWRSLIDNGATVHWIHRWLAFAVLAGAAWLHFAEIRLPAGRPVRRAAAMLMGLVVVQIALGVTTIWFHVPVAIALIHQAVAVALLSIALFVLHRLTPVAERAA